jgi:phage tail sheath protein FI
MPRHEEEHMKKYEAPGVYIVEKNAYPAQVVEVATDVPIFIGYTERAVQQGKDVTGVPVRVTSLNEFELWFGKAPAARFDFSLRAGEPVLEQEDASRFILHSAIRLFWENGGSKCWILSVGCYGKGEPAIAKSAEHFGEAVWQEVAQQQEPSMIVIPEAVLLPSPEDYKAVWDRGLAHCAETKKRVAIVDVFNGDTKRTYDEADVISGKTGLRNMLSAEDLSFAAAFYPWVNTALHVASDITFDNISAGTRKAFFDYIRQDPDARANEAQKAALEKALDLAVDDETSDAEKARGVQSLRVLSKRYKDLIDHAVAALNVVPPSSALAGAYAMTDTRTGVWEAPANIGLLSVVSPCVDISDAEQDDLNAPLDGKAVNAIRSFPARGTLVWGARTLDANSQDWRYVNVRRMAIMMEQSIKSALDPFVFSPNTEPTWRAIKLSIESFLNSLWMRGALMGASANEAYRVEVGLGTTMTATDVEAGTLNVVVQVSLLRPAEFLVLPFRLQVRTKPD